MRSNSPAPSTVRPWGQHQLEAGSEPLIIGFRWSGQKRFCFAVFNLDVRFLGWLIGLKVIFGLMRFMSPNNP